MCACSPHFIGDTSFQKLTSILSQRPNMFFARKFDPSLDINPINSLEQSLGGFQSESQGFVFTNI